MNAAAHATAAGREQARAAAQRAMPARAALIARIDSRRDLTAQYVGELQVAYDRLQQQVAAARGPAWTCRSRRSAAPWTGRWHRARDGPLRPDRPARRRRRQKWYRHRGAGRHAGARGARRHRRICRSIHRLWHARHPRPWRQQLHPLRLPVVGRRSTGARSWTPGAELGRTGSGPGTACRTIFRGPHRRSCGRSPTMAEASVSLGVSG